MNNAVLARANNPQAPAAQEKDGGADGRDDGAKRGDGECVADLNKQLWERAPHLLRGGVGPQ